LRPALQGIKITVACRHCVSDEDEIELRAFRSLSQLDVMRKIHTSIDLCIRMQPSRDVISCRMEKPAEVNSAAPLAQCLHQCRPAHSDIRADIRKPRATNPPVRAFSEVELVMAGLGPAIHVLAAQ
jgi:hypothetical protein